MSLGLLYHLLACACGLPCFVVARDSLVLGMVCRVIAEHDYLQSLTLPQPLQSCDTEALEMAWASRHKPVLPPIEWQLAIAMSLHPRLGGDSHLHRLEALMVHFAGFCAYFARARVFLWSGSRCARGRSRAVVGRCLMCFCSSVSQIKDIVERTSSEFELRLVDISAVN